MTMIAKEIHPQMKWNLIVFSSQRDETRGHPNTCTFGLGLKPGHTAFGLKQHSLTACSSNVLLNLSNIISMLCVHRGKAKERRDKN